MIIIEERFDNIGWQIIDRIIDHKDGIELFQYLILHNPRCSFRILYVPEV